MKSASTQAIGRYAVFSRLTGQQISRRFVTKREAIAWRRENVERRRNFAVRELPDPLPPPGEPRASAPGGK